MLIVYLKMFEFDIYLLLYQVTKICKKIFTKIKYIFSLQWRFYKDYNLTKFQLVTFAYIRQISAVTFETLQEYIS